MAILSNHLMHFFTAFISNIHHHFCRNPTLTTAYNTIKSDSLNTLINSTFIDRCTRIKKKLGNVLGLIRIEDSEWACPQWYGGVLSEKCIVERYNRMMMESGACYSAYQIGHDNNDYDGVNNNFNSNNNHNNSNTDSIVNNTNNININKIKSFFSTITNTDTSISFKEEILLPLLTLSKYNKCDTLRIKHYTHDKSKSGFELIGNGNKMVEVVVDDDGDVEWNEYELM